MDILAAAVVVATFVFIIGGAEVRLALLAGGAVLVLAAWKREAWFASFATSMVQAGLVPVILPAIGFTAIIKLAKCDEHLVRLVVGPLLKLRGLIIPATVVKRFFHGMGEAYAGVIGIIIAAGYAGVSVFDIARRTAVPAIAAAVVVVVILGFIG